MDTHDPRDPNFVRWPYTPLCHETTLADYLKKGPVLEDGDARRTLVHMPKRIPPATAVPFLVAGYTLHVGPRWEMLSASGSLRPVAVYREDYSVLVDSAHRGRGLAVMMVVWRDEKRGQGPAEIVLPRTRATWRLTGKAHQILVERALQRGAPVPARVLEDYPELAARAHNNKGTQDG